MDLTIRIDSEEFTPSLPLRCIHTLILILSLPWVRHPCGYVCRLQAQMLSPIAWWQVHFLLLKIDYSIMQEGDLLSFCAEMNVRRRSSLELSLITSRARGWTKYLASIQTINALLLSFCKLSIQNFSLACSFCDKRSLEASLSCTTQLRRQTRLRLD